MCNTYTFDVNLWLKYPLSYIFISFIYFLPLVTFGFIKPQYQPKVSKGVAFIRNFNNQRPTKNWGPTEAWEDDRGHQFQAFLQSECERLQVRQQTPRIQASTERKIEIVMDAWFFGSLVGRWGWKPQFCIGFLFWEGREGRRRICQVKGGKIDMDQLVDLMLICSCMWNFCWNTCLKEVISYLVLIWLWNYDRIYLYIYIIDILCLHAPSYVQVLHIVYVIHVQWKLFWSPYFFVFHYRADFAGVF